MAVASATPERIDLSEQMNRSPSQLSSDGMAEASNSNIFGSAGTPDRNDSSNSSPNPSVDSDVQVQLALRSEEYRQLFRLPSEEVLLQDFNCAFQESILLQGHMYLFAHHICFYSNIFGFETKKVIPFNEITSVKRAKTAGIFPNAIEIIAGGKKYFFASFLSRDEAFKLIIDGWEQNCNGSITTEQLVPISENSSQDQDNGSLAIENINSFEQPSNEPDSINGDEVKSTASAPQVLPNVGNDVERDANMPISTEPSSSTDTCIWKVEDSDGPKVSQEYTKVAETKFPIKVEDLFNLYFSDISVDFVEAFHKKCGDKEFKSSTWHPHEKFGHARDLSFQHPIKIYLGAKFGGCKEVQKFRIYRNSRLIIETSQEVSDVPYADYFTVEGLWDVERITDGIQEGCILRIYVNVAFTKRTIWKGKIVQSTLEECREAYAIWIEMAQEFLKQKLQKEGSALAISSVQDIVQQMELETKSIPEPSETSPNHTETSHSVEVNHQMGNILQGGFMDATSITAILKELMRKSYSLLNNQSRLSVVVAIAFIVIFLMQMSILVLLNRPQHVHVNYPMEYRDAMGGERSPENIAWLERRVHHLKDEMLMVEARLERLQHEHASLKSQLKALENPKRRR